MKMHEDSALKSLINKSMTILDEIRQELLDQKIKNTEEYAVAASRI